METKMFELVLQTIATGLVDKIISESGLSEDIAMEKLYASKLYAMLEKEDTKVWHFSVSMLYELYKKERDTGNLIFPEC